MHESCMYLIYGYQVEFVFHRQTCQLSRFCRESHDFGGNNIYKMKSYSAE